MGVVDTRLEGKGATPRRTRAGAPYVQRYWAFLSYSHQDSKHADWLHSALEKYRFPKALVGRHTASGIVPERLNPVFRDRQELAAGDLDKALLEALASSRVLVVLCSPASAASRWTNEEIRRFKRLRPDALVLAAIVDGEPWAADMPGREAEECFPDALKHRFDTRGRATAERAEPIAADLRPQGDGRALGLLKLVAGIAGVRLDDLVQRDVQRRHRRMVAITGASLAAATIASGLAVTAVLARNEARDQRRQAEGLVGFMLGDLKDRLQPLGRLDALDAVGSHALAYYESQDKGSLNDAGLAQRARALTMMGEIAQSRGDMDGAQRRYREALAGTAEALRRKPTDPQRMFDHAQNVFWVASIDFQRGKLAGAENGFRQYLSLANAMIAAQGNHAKWQLEKIYAEQNLGIVLLAKGNSEAAAKVFADALTPVESLHAAEPNNRQYREMLAETLANLSEARGYSGRIEEAIAGRERQLTLIKGWLVEGPTDVGWLQKIVPIQRDLARLFGWRGELDLSLAHRTDAVAAAARLVATEPNNSGWLEQSARADYDLSESLLLAGRTDDAAAAIRSGCDKTERLVALDASVTVWNLNLRRNCQTGRASRALASGSAEDAVAPVERALALARSDHQPEGPGYVGSVLHLQGDIEARLGRPGPAMAAWRAAAAALARAPSRPNRLAERAVLARRLGDSATATTLQQRLAAIGYRQSDYLKAMQQGDGR